MAEWALAAVGAAALILVFSAAVVIALGSIVGRVRYGLWWWDEELRRD